MTKNSEDERFNFDTKGTTLLLHTDNEWDKIRKELNKLGIEVIEFFPKIIENDHWTLHIEHKPDEDKPDANNDSNINHQPFNRRLNNSLANAFTKDKNIQTKYWSSNFSKLERAGFYIPINDTRKVKNNIIKSHICFYKLLTQHFPYQEFLLDLLETKIELKDNEPLAPHAVWSYIYHYSKFLIGLKENFIDSYDEYKHWFSELLDLDNFHYRLPSEQITILLLNLCETIISDNELTRSNSRFFNMGIDEVRSFLATYRSELSSLFSQSDNAQTSEQLPESSKHMRIAFAEIFSKDYDDLLIQEILDNKAKLNLSKLLSLQSQLKYGPKSLYNVSGIIKDSFFGLSDRPAGEFKEDDIRLPNYKRLKKKIYNENVQYWYDLVVSERKEILYQLQNKLEKRLDERSKKVTDLRCDDHWNNLLNLISAPILFWKNENELLYPQFNLLSDSAAKNLKERFKQKEKEKKKEKLVLEQHIQTIHKIDSPEELEAYLANISTNFSFEDLNKIWNDQLIKVKNRFEQREKYYQTRMKEFGFHEADLGKSQKKIMLQEIFKIEEEVKPYITYVKKAFQSALPIRKKISFSKYRHESDGVEFDSDTLFDQEKWIRADVMKVMESKTETGEATQINTFCLDYSGSMNHDRMRNLFKILYLLVLGLEDRKSFDAFHFFSNNFIHVLDFSEDFTNRKVLYRIMQQITSIENGQVIYFGAGGTNISHGIEKSHEKMKAFADNYKETNPTANIVTSLFVITDGEPSLGILEIPLLNEFIETKRQDGDVEIKGIFIKSEDDDEAEMLEGIFGENNYIETTDFQDGVNKFVKIMSQTYKQQRMTYKWKQKRQKLGLTK